LCKDKVKERFNTKELGQLKKHLGIWYEWKYDQGGELYVEATMPELVEDIMAMTEKHLGGELKPYQTPGIPGDSLVKHEGDPVDNKNYRSIVQDLVSDKQDDDRRMQCIKGVSKILQWSQGATLAGSLQICGILEG